MARKRIYKQPISVVSAQEAARLAAVRLLLGQSLARACGRRAPALDDASSDIAAKALAGRPISAGEWNRARRRFARLATEVAELVALADVGE
jgi:hypothetical protein